MKSGLFAALALAVLLSSCGDKLQTREAVVQGVKRGIAQRGLSADAMDISVTDVKFRGKQADAVVAFAPKGGRISDGLTMRYTLEQRNNEWVITGRSAMDMKQHTGGAAPQPGVNPGLTDPHSGAGNQAGSPPPDPSRPLPAGHPRLGGISK